MLFPLFQSPSSTCPTAGFSHLLVSNSNKFRLPLLNYPLCPLPLPCHFLLSSFFFFFFFFNQCLEYSFFRWLIAEYKAETSRVPFAACPHPLRQCLSHSGGSDIFGEWMNFEIQCRKSCSGRKSSHSPFAVGSRYLWYLMTYSSSPGSCRGPFWASPEVNFWGAEGNNTR